MYLSAYNLQDKPFEITTDSRFLWLGEQHKEALATLRYGIQENMGCLLLTGDVGTGKTTLINALINNLGSEVIVARITDPKLTVKDFFLCLAHEFSLEESFNTKGKILLALKDLLEKSHAEGKQALLIIDEAQLLPLKVLEEIRLLSNIEKEYKKLLNIFFVGQKEFNNFLLRPQNKAIRQRITVMYTLEPLTEQEIGDYIRHRLSVAGRKKEIFTQNAIPGIYQFSQGAPRLINILCNRALVTGFVRDSKTIGEDIIAECAAELQISPAVEDKLRV